MPSFIVGTTVRRDEQEITRRLALDNARLGVIVQAAVGGFALLSLTLAILLPVSLILVLLQLVVAPALGWWLALFLVGRDPDHWRRMLPPAALAAAGLVLAVLTALSLPGQAPAAKPPAPFLAALVGIVACGIGSLLWLARRDRRWVLLLGLRRQQWVYNMWVGLGAGAAIGLHMLMVMRHFPDLALPLPAWPALLWALAYNAGLRAPAEELLFRGLAYYLLTWGAPARLGRILLQVVPINVLIYLVYLAQIDDLVVRAWVLAYIALLSVVTTLLRWKQDSLVPSLACSAAAGAFAVAVILL